MNENPAIKDSATEVVGNAFVEFASAIVSTPLRRNVVNTKLLSLERVYDILRNDDAERGTKKQA